MAETKMRPRRWQFFSRQDRDETLVCLETETSRPRPQPCFLSGPLLPSLLQSIAAHWWVPSYTACWQCHVCVCVNNLPGDTIRNCSIWELQLDLSVASHASWSFQWLCIYGLYGAVQMLLLLLLLYHCFTYAVQHSCTVTVLLVNTWACMSTV